MIDNFKKSTEYAQNLFVIEDEIKSKIEHESLLEKVPIITREVLKYMLFEANRINAKNILEIGSATGFSGIFLAEIANKNGGKLTTIEIDEARYEKAVNNFELMGMKNRNDLILSDALEVMKDLKDKKFDFIFIDASKGQYKKFFEMAYEMLEKGGIIFIDNIMFRGLIAEDIENVPKRYKTIVRKLNEFIFELNDKYNFVLLPFGDGVGIVSK